MSPVERLLVPSSLGSTIYEPDKTAVKRNFLRNFLLGKPGGPDFFIMSHPEVRAVAEARCRDVLAAFDRAGRR